MSIPDLDANFYSGPILKHVANIRQSVLVPHSMSSSSIHHSLENEKTSYMKNSPSMKALESMLANKKKPAEEVIAEESEGDGEPSEPNQPIEPIEPIEPNEPNVPSEPNEPIQQVHAIHPIHPNQPNQLNAPHSPPARALHGESSSVQSFQTASSVDMSPSKHTSKSARTDGTGSSTYDETPELIQPAQFHTIKQTTKDFSPSIRVIPAFHDRRESAYSDHDETLIEPEQEPAHAPSPSQPASRLMIPDGILDSESKSKTILATMAAKQKPKEPKPKEPKEPKPKEQKEQKPKPAEPMHPDVNPGKLTASATSPHLAQASAKNPESFPTHTRSNSSFSLSFNKNKDQPPIPGRQRRSSTFSDLTSKYFVNSKPEEKTKAKPKPEKPSAPEPAKKKFSFRALFKKKEPASIPTSASSPALAKPVSQTAGKNAFKKSKSTDTLSHLDEQKDIREKEVRERDDRELRGVAKANSGKKLADISNIQQPTISQSQLSETSGPQFFNPPPKQGLIREVSDYELNDTYANSEPEDEYDRHNLSSDPATPYNPGRFDQEMKLDTGFGSPFQVEYKSPQQIEDDAKEDQSNENKQSTDKDAEPSDPSEQLLGEALFPRSLSAQEVQSIVSLERSRSIRSVRSKHNSFANYNGSDDNIIQYTGAVSEPSSGIARSESILKRAKEQHLSTPSPKKAKSPTLSPDGTSDLNNFIEFSDYIDFDKLDFQLSPNPSLYRPTSPARTPVRQPSPIIISSSASVESQKQRPVSVVVTPAEREEVEDLEEVEPEKPEVEPVIEPESEPEAELLEPQLKPAAIVVSEPDEEYAGPLTPNLETIDSFKLPSPTALPEEEVVPRARDKPAGARPISMSFRGLRGPNFGEKLTMHEVRSSESHQLFNISFGDDSNESGVGDGFGGSSDDLDLDLDLELENDKENIPLVLAVPPPRPLFIHKKISLWASTDTQSSPSSMNSFITRTFKRPPKANVAVPQSPTGVRFSSRIILYDTYNGDDYDRHPDTATCNQLTPALAQMIKEELNQVKSEMEVHEDLRCYTHFF